MSDRPPAAAPENAASNSSAIRPSVSRRHFLRVAGAGTAAAAGVAAAGVSAAAAAPLAAPTTVPHEVMAGSQPATTAVPGAAVDFPRSQVAQLSGLQVGQVARANYPDDQSPILILKIGSRVSDGVGPDGDIVAYSSFCTHLGCSVAWRQDVQILSCPCHFSSFDPARGGMQVIGQATTNLPQVVLEADGDNLMAVGMRGLIWGRQNNLQFTA